MSTPPEGSGSVAPSADPDAKPSVDEIQADIDQTRAELGDTIEALTAKLDVKARAKHKVGEVRDQAMTGVGTAQDRATDLAGRARDAATDEQGKVRPAVPVGAIAVLLVVVVAVVWRRRR